MKPFTYAIPCLFGLEGLVGDEVRRLGLEDVQVENGRVLCCGTGADLPRLNLDLRGVQPAPLLGVEGTLQPGRTVPGDQRRLDGDGPGAAEGVPEGVLPTVAAEDHHGRRQGLPQGCLHPDRPVAPLMQAGARGIQVQGTLVLKTRSRPG